MPTPTASTAASGGSHRLAHDYASAGHYARAVRTGELGFWWRSLGGPQLVEMFPAAAGAEIDHAWSGVLGVPRDWCISVAADPGAGLAWAGGYVGEGVAAANLAADRRGWGGSSMPSRAGDDRPLIARSAQDSTGVSAAFPHSTQEP
jgi:hypothetical protein